MLCESYTVSEDALKWTFVLRAGVRFSDGSALTAADVAASLNQARASALYSARFTGVTGVSAGEGTVSVTLSSPNGGLPALLDVPVCKGTGERPAGTGPYVLAGEADALVLEARTDWWQGNALPRQSIPLRSIQEADDLIRAFDTRDVALVATDLTGTNALGFSGSFETVDYPTSTMLYVGFNTASGPCRDAGLRRALQQSFDRDAVVTAQFSRHALAAALPVSPVSPLYDGALAGRLAYSSQALAQALARRGLVPNGRELAAGAGNAGAALRGARREYRPDLCGGAAGKKPDRRRGLSGIEKAVLGGLYGRTGARRLRSVSGGGAPDGGF